MKTYTVFLVLLVSVLTSCDVPQGSHPSAQTVKYLTSENMQALNLPFSEAVRVGNLLFLSGQVGVLPGTLDLAPGGIAGETRQALDNISKVLRDNGASMDDLVKCTIMLADISEWGDMNKVYATYFPHHFPARSAFATNGLALGARTEIECIAAFDDEKAGK